MQTKNQRSVEDSKEEEEDERPLMIKKRK